MAGKKGKGVSALTHEGARRVNIPTAELDAAMAEGDRAPIRCAYARRNRDLDPQLVWRGKDEQDAAELTVQAPPLYIQEKVHPKVLIDDLLRQSKRRREEAAEEAPDLFADFNGLPEGDARTEFYRHDANWSNRMILGDALRVMASLAEREGLRGKVQAIYIDPPYGIRFNSNFQWSTRSRDVKDGKAAHITREPEQVKAFRDTWSDGIHSYLSYLRDRLTVARELLAPSGSVFVQIGDENVHRVRAVMDEVFGEGNFVSFITMAKTSSSSGSLLSSVSDYILWYGKDRASLKYRQLHMEKNLGSMGSGQYTWIEDTFGFRRNQGRAITSSRHEDDSRIFRPDNITSQRPAGDGDVREFQFHGQTYNPGKGTFKSDLRGLHNLRKANRLFGIGKTLCYVRYLGDFPVYPVSNNWGDTGASGFGDPKIYVVQTLPKVVERCLLMTTDPGDLVLDPTCGSGTTAYVAEQWGRRWITIDTSRVALALARARIMGARYPWYLLADSPEGQRKEAELAGRAPSEAATGGDVRQGFVYRRVPHVTLKSIANNAEIDGIWEKWEERLGALRERLSGLVNRGEGGRPLEEWEIPRERPDGWPPEAEAALAEFWQARIARQREIDASIAARADSEYLYDKPYEDRERIRVAGPFTVESLAPHRMLAVDEDGETFRSLTDDKSGYGEAPDFAAMILENLRTAGVQQAHREGRIAFSSLAPWPGRHVCAEGRYAEGGEGGPVRRAGVFIGPEFGTVQRPDLVAAAREAADAGFDVLVACAFSYEAHASEFERLGRVPVLKARMNADLHMAGELKNTGKGNLFVVFGEPDVEVAGGRWLVAGNGKMIARYEHIKELSGLGGLEEINGAGGRGLSALCRAGGAGAVRPGTSRGERADARRSQAIAAIEALNDGDFPLSLTTGHWLQVTLHGVDVFHPNTGEICSGGPDDIALWFVDSDYNEESFFVRQAYFLGADDPYKALKTTLKAEIDPEAWASLRSDTSRPFPAPASGRIAVKVINHLGDEAMKVFRV